MGPKKHARLGIIFLLAIALGLSISEPSVYANERAKAYEDGSQNSAGVKENPEVSPDAAGIGSANSADGMEREAPPQASPSGTIPKAENSELQAPPVHEKETRPTGQSNEKQTPEDTSQSGALPPDSSVVPRNENSAQAAGTAAGEPERPQPGPALSPKMKVVVSLLAGAGVSLVTGGVFGIVALEEKSRYQVTEHRDFEDRVQARAIAADVFLGVAAATAVATLIYYFAADDTEKTASMIGRSPRMGQGGLSIPF